MPSNHNPFAPPSQEAEFGEDDEDFEDDERPRNASRGTRLVNSLVDSVANTLLSSVMGFFYGLTRLPVDPMLGAVVVLSITVFATIGYHVFFEYFFNKTPAKWLTHTRVVRVDGGRPRFLQIVGRTLARYVPFEPLSFLSRTVGWHDRWSGTRVIVDRR